MNRPDGKQTRTHTHTRTRARKGTHSHKAGDRLIDRTNEMEP